MASSIDTSALVEMLDGLRCGILVLRRNGPGSRAPTIELANATASVLLGVPGHRLVGRRLRAIGAVDAARGAFIELLGAVHRGAAASVELAVRSAEGTLRMLRIDGGVLPGRADLYVLRMTGRDAAATRPPTEDAAKLARLSGGLLYRFAVLPHGGLELAWADEGLPRLLGAEPAALLKQGGWLEHVLPADLARLVRRNQRALAGEAGEAVYRVRTSDGHVLRIVDLAMPEPAGADGVVREITGVVRHVAPTGTAATAAAILADLTGGTLVCLIDVEGRIERVEGGAADALGDRLRAALGGPLAAALDVDTAEDWADWIDQARIASCRIQGRFAFGEETREAAFLAIGDEGVLIVLDPPASQPRPNAGWDGIEVPLVILDAARAVTAANRSAAQKLGLAAPVLTGRAFMELVGQGLDEGPPPGWGLVPLPDDRWLALPSEQVTAESEARRRAVLDHVADGVVELDENARVVWASRSATLLLGVGTSSLRGALIADLVRPLEGAADDLLLRIAGVAPHPVSLGEWQLRRGGLQPVAVEILGARLDHAGETTTVLTVRDVTQRRESEQTIRNLAYSDPLTGLPNRLLFHDRLAQAIERARRNRQMLSVMLVDLDRFKLINDSLGLDKGDTLLRMVAERLVATLRKSDTVGRFSGDEFLVLAPGTETLEAAAKVGQKLLDALKKAFVIDGREITIAASVGIALYPLDGEAAEPLIKNADTALSRAKEQGRNAYRFYKTDMNAKALQRLMLESGLRRALELGELTLHYQPQVSLTTGAIVGVEALLRWQHPEFGMVPPNEFVPIAEETGLIVPIGEWVMRTAVEEVATWRGGGAEDVRVAVNLSARQFADPQLVEIIERLLADTGFAAHRLELELTESMIMRDAQETVRRLGEISALGVRLTVDDFGSGYSSLNYLRRFPINALKIDQTFIRDVPGDPNDSAIARAIVALADSLRLQVVAEGVETREQLEFLQSCHCGEIQGYLFSRPLPADAAARLVTSGQIFPV